ncbi:MAG: chemotaxis response regulator protein-glutamate methylesterase [Deltaproteobacteria bacterium]|nr:chemotaxis response regulator protein-glutamate methylesterase [Nannocystaceae bacterium]
MPRTRVLIVDDSVVIRKLVGEGLALDPSIEVIGTASSGQTALSRLAVSTPDVVTLDIEMPGMDGLATLKEIRRRFPKLPVIMVSTLTQRGALMTLDCLAAGASDYVAKPTGLSSPAAGRDWVRSELAPRVLQFESKVAVPGAAPAIVRQRGPAPARTRGFEVLAIGSSTGGPTALHAVFASLPADFPLPIVIVQHMPPIFTRLLAERLDQVGRIRVEEATDGAVLEPGRAWVAPGGRHMQITTDGPRRICRLVDTPAEHSVRPAVDVMFRSLPAIYGPGILALILTGMGADGLLGCEIIKQAGGSVIVQDKATSVVWGMPGVVSAAGLADQTLPLARIGPTIMSMLRPTAQSRPIAPRGLAVGG